jgi:N-methylhydantoinase B
MRVDAAELEIFKNLFHSVAEEMGAALRRSAFSPNIKERRDYSCAVFDGKGRVVAMGDHMPVHLGSMPMSVAAAIGAFQLGPGDIAMLNDPYAGGTHLPDITLVMPVFGHRREKAKEIRTALIERRYSERPMFYVANRAHHSDIGGARPASMGLSEEIYQEGLRIPPVRLARRGRIERDVLAILLANVRTPREREGDLTAQVAACRLGARRLTELAGKYGAARTTFYLEALQRYSATLMREALMRIPDGVYRAEDFLDDDGFVSRPVRLRVAIRVRRGRALVDFAGTSPACRGSVNAVLAITCSAVFYVFRCLLGEDVPACAGLMDPIEVRAPQGSVVNARPPAAVAGGNVETSQRIVDVLFRALARALPDRIPAASSGTMNNLSFGGIDPRTGEPFAYYETIAGGMGARPTLDGLSGVHTHMTNSLNTPIEALESAYPVRVRRYSLRRGSGGAGKHRGGDGIVREIEFLADVRGSILSDRRRIQPYGLAGGKPGKAGRNRLLTAGRSVELPSKTSFEAPTGSTLRIETPGGGGWGNPSVDGSGDPSVDGSAERL